MFAKIIIQKYNHKITIPEGKKIPSFSLNSQRAQDSTARPSDRAHHSRSPCSAPPPTSPRRSSSPLLAGRAFPAPARVPRPRVPAHLSAASGAPAPPTPASSAPACVHCFLKFTCSPAGAPVGQTGDGAATRGTPEYRRRGSPRVRATAWEEGRWPPAPGGGPERQREVKLVSPQAGLLSSTNLFFYILP